MCIARRSCDFPHMVALLTALTGFLYSLKRNAGQRDERDKKVRENIAFFGGGEGGRRGTGRQGLVQLRPTPALTCPFSMLHVVVPVSSFLFVVVVLFKSYPALFPPSLPSSKPLILSFPLLGVIFVFLFFTYIDLEPIHQHHQHVPDCAR